MLIQEDHPIIGSSGDVDLDAVLTNRALTLLGSGEPMSVVFEVGWTTKEGSSREPASFGVIHVLLEPLPFSVRSPHIRFIEDCLRSRTPGVIASIFRVDGEIKATVGSHVFLHGDGRIEEDARNPVLSAAITEDCVRALQSKSSMTKEYRLTEGVVETLMEFIDVQ